MWRERGTDQSTEGLYSAGASNNFGSSGTGGSNRRSVLHALRNRYPYNGLLQAGGVLLVMLAVYAALLAAIGQNVRLPGSVWTVCLIWICAQAAGFVAAKIGFPPTVGMVAVGLLLQNFPGNVLERLPFMWSVKLRFAGLVLVLLQAGLVPTVQVSDSAGQMPVLALSVLPLAAEAVAVSLCLGLWFKLDVFMAIAGAIILAAACPALINATTHEWQQSRLGTRKGTPSLLLRGVRWNMFFAIAAFSIFLGLAVPHQSLGLQTAHGPLSIVTGVSAGVLLGVVCAFTPVWSRPLGRALALLASGELMAFCGVTWHFPAAGFLGVLAMASLTDLLWRRAPMSRLCDQIAPGASFKCSAEVHDTLEIVWATAIQPLVMGLAGASIKFSTLQTGVALKALAVAAAGLFIRGFMALATLVSCRFSWSESSVMALVWMSAGSIQATLAAAPLELSYLYKSTAPQYTAWAEAIALVGIYSILIGATTAWLAAGVLGPLCLVKQEEELPVVAQPVSPEANENNPFLSGLQQSGISMTGNGNKGLVNQMLHKTDSLEAQGRHGNPFSDDSEVGRYDKAPLLIASADSSYALDVAGRVPSHNPFSSARNGDFHQLQSIRRITSGESAGSPLGPNRSSKSVPALARPPSSTTSTEFHAMSDEDKRRISESFLWENEPMSAAAILGGHHTDELGRSFSTRRISQNASFTSPGRSSHDAASCLWENEPMSAAASAAVPRLTLERVSEVPEATLVISESNVLDRPASISATELVDAPRLASVKTRQTRSGVPAWRPHRPAPPPPLPQRSNSFPTHQPNEDYLEYEVTSSLTLKETPRSQRRHDLQRELLQRQQKDGVQLVNTVARHHHTSDSPHVSFALTDLTASGAPPASADALEAVASDPLTSQIDADVEEDVNSLATEPLLPPSLVQLVEVDHQLDTASSVASISTVDEVADELLDDVADDAEAALLTSRPASMLTMYESAHSGALSDGAGSESHLDQE